MLVPVLCQQHHAIIVNVASSQTKHADLRVFCYKADRLSGYPVAISNPTDVEVLEVRAALGDRGNGYIRDTPTRSKIQVLQPRARRCDLQDQLVRDQVTSCQRQECECPVLQKRCNRCICDVVANVNFQLLQSVRVLPNLLQRLYNPRLLDFAHGQRA